MKGSENYASFRKRIVKAFNEITSIDNYSTVAIITHGGPIRCIVREVLKEGELTDLGDCAIITINKDGKNLSIANLEGAKLEAPFVKRLKFHGKLPKLILDGKKTSTWRINDEKQIAKGEILSLCYDNGKEFARAKVNYVNELPFEKLGESDKLGHEKFKSEKEMYATYSKYYNTKITPKTRVKIIRFSLIQV